MVIAYIFLFIATILLIEVFQGLRDFQIVDANTFHYVNVTNPLPQMPNQTLTSSIRKRVGEVYGAQYSPLNSLSLEEPTIHNPKIQTFYKKYMESHLNKLSKTFIYPEKDNTLKFISLNSEWMQSEPYSSIALYTLGEDRLYQMNTRDTRIKAWRYCSYQHIDGALEAASYDKDQDLFAAAFNDPVNNQHFLVYYNSLQCNYNDALDATKFKQLYCEYYNNAICAASAHYPTDVQFKKNNTLNTEEDYWKGLLETSKEKDGSDENLTENQITSEHIELPENSSILNLAVTENMLAYTTLEDKMKISWIYKNSDGEWEPNVLEYPVMFQGFRFFQNLGMGFISDSWDGEKQLLIVDLVANEAKLSLVYFVYRFADGQTIINEDSLMKDYNIDEDEEIDPDKIYASGLFELHRIDINRDLTTVDILQGSSFPKSIIKTEPKSRETAVLSLQKYVFLLGMEARNGIFSMYSVRDFEDQTYKIKDFDISDNGVHFALLAYSKEKMKVFILNTKALYDIDEEKLYLVNFDYSVNPENGNIKEVKLFRSIDNELLLMLLLEAGEVATFSLQFGVMSLGGLSSLFLGDELDLFSLLSVVAIILMFLFMKIATSMRFQVNLRPGGRQPG